MVNTKVESSAKVHTQQISCRAGMDRVGPPGPEADSLSILIPAFLRDANLFSQ